MFRSNVSSKFLCFVGKVFDENTGKVSTRVNGWQYLRWMSIWECINYLVQFFTGRCQGYSFSVKFTLGCVHKYWNLVLCLSVQVLEIANFVFLHFLSAWRLSLLAIKSSSLIDSNHGEELWVITFRREGGACLSSTVTELVCIFNRWKLWNTGKFSNKWWAVNVSNVPNSPV